MSLKWPMALLVLLLPVAIVIWRRYKKPLIKPIFVSESAKIKNLPSFAKITKKAKYYQYAETIILLLIIASLALLVARPVAPSTSYSIEKSRDIVLLLDVSGSMKEMIPSMIDVMEDVVKNNPSERYSIVTFRGYANTVMPLTRDPVAIKNSIDLLRKVYRDHDDPNYNFGSLNGWGTDIGEGVLGAVNRFDNLEIKKSRNIILLTDLEQTGGDMDPNLEFYLDKVSLIPKYNINFYILKTAAEFEFAVNNEIADYGGATVYDVDESNKESSVRDITTKIFNQILNNQRSIGKNLTDSPNILIFLTLLLSCLLITLRYMRWKKL